MLCVVANFAVPVIIDTCRISTDCHLFIIRETGNFCRLLFSKPGKRMFFPKWILKSGKKTLLCSPGPLYSLKVKDCTV